MADIVSIQQKIIAFTPLETNCMYYTYVLQSTKDGKWYTGFTGDLQKRFSDHNAGRVPVTKNRGPFELIYYEACLHEQDATAREKYLESGMGKRYVRNRLKRFLSLTGR
jgi:putative endonuclease